MTRYDLRISTEQYDMLVAALRNYKYPACFEPSDRDELDALTDMFVAAESFQHDAPNAEQILNDFTS